MNMIKTNVNDEVSTMNNLDGDRKIDAGIKLNRSEEKFNKLFEYSPFGMAMIKHATGEFIEVNQALLQWTGYTKEEFLNLSFWDITPPEYQYQEKQQMLDLEAKGRFGPNDKEYIRKDGSRFPIRIKGFTIEDVDGTKLVWGIIEDISNEYERILESLQDAYIQFDLAYHLIMVNKGAVKMFGYTTKDEMIGMKLHDFFVDHSIFNRIKEDLETSHKLSNCICECVRKNGTSIWISFNAQHIKDKNDKTVSMEGLMRDTTERKRLEDSLINKGKELEASEERFRLMIENISDTIGITDDKGRIKFRSANNERLLGIKPEDALGKSAFDFVHPDDRERLYQDFLNLIAKGSGTATSGEFKYLRKDGSTIFVELEGRNMLDNKLINGLLLTFRDVTDRKASDRKIKEETEKLKALIESTDNMVWVVDPIEFGLMTFNRALSHYFKTGRNLDIHEGMSPKDLLPDEFANEWKKMYEKVLTQGAYKIEYKTSSNNRTLELSFFPVRIDNELIGISVMGQDITDRKNMEMALRESEERFRGIVSSMDDVIYTLDTDQRHTGVFGNWLEKSNLTETDFIGKTSSDIFGSEIGMVHDKPTRKALTGQNVVYEWEMANNNERTFYQTSLSPMYDPLGNIKGVVGLGRDITNIKKSEIELLNSKNRFVKAQEIGRFGHWHYDISNQKFTGSKVTFEIYGFLDQEEVSFDDVVSCIAKSDVDRVVESFNQLIANGQRLDEQFEITQVGSEHSIYVRNIADLSVDENGNTVVEGVIQDITELKQLELQLVKTAKQSQRILDNMQDAYFQADLSGRFTIINPKAVTMYGYLSASEMIGQPAETLYANSEDRAYLIEKLKESGALQDYSCRGRKKDGTVFNVSMNIQFVKDESGNIIGTEGLVRDITDRMRLEEELENEKRSLEISNQKLSERLNQSVTAISKIGEMRDVYTAGHQKRVQQLACEIAKQMGLSDEVIMNISYGALIHDIGKIYIASDILNKPGKISDLEYQILQTHAENSYEIVKEIDFPKEIPTMIYQHHERLDGSGYPKGLSGDAIILESRILAVADVVEAMTSHRPYRAALGFDAAIEEIQNFRGTKYDSKVVDICVDLIKNGYRFV